jgi:hypothetical protein
LQWAKQYQSEHQAPSESWVMLRSKKLWLAFGAGLFLGALVVLVLRRRRKS